MWYTSIIIMVWWSVLKLKAYLEQIEQVVAARKYQYSNDTFVENKEKAVDS